MLSLLFVFQFAFVTVSAIIFEDCGSAYDLYSVDIEGCGWSLPCYVTLGEETPVNVQFYAEFSSNLLDQKVTIKVNLVDVNADVTPDPCVTVDCPVTTGAVNSFTSVMSVPDRMALNQRGFLKWRVFNEKRQLVLCYSVLVQTQSRLQSRLRKILLQVTPDSANDIVDNLHLKDFQDYETTYLLNENHSLQSLIDQYFENLKVQDQTIDI